MATSPTSRTIPAPRPAIDRKSRSGTDSRYVLMLTSPLIIRRQRVQQAEATTRHDIQRRDRRTRRTKPFFSAGSASSALIVVGTSLPTGLVAVKVAARGR